jgi:hemoglobin
MTVPIPTTDDTADEQSLYQRLGGAPTVQVAVERFYERLLDDPRLAPYFEGVDLARIKRHQVFVIGNVLGGPARYEGVGLEAAHASLGITEDDYDQVGGHLLAVFAELGAGDEAAETVSAALAQLRPLIVTA